MSGLLPRALIPFVLAAWTAAAQDGPVPETAADLSALGADDECQAGNTERCGLNAMQLRRQSMSLGEGEGEQVQRVYRGPGLSGVIVAGPWEQCGGKDFGGPVACAGDYGCFNVTDHYSQCKPLHMQCGGKDWKGATECPEDFVCFAMSEDYSVCKPKGEVDLDFQEYEGSDVLNNVSEAEVLTFYMYRVVDAGDYPPTNANLGSIGAALFYLHSRLAACKRGCEATRTEDNLERIARYKVMTKATEPLFRAGKNFGANHNFVAGQCTADGCDEIFAKYGYSVGCQDLPADHDFYYSGAFYSLPAECPAKERDMKSLDCKLGQPGGLCQGELTGTGTCTWNYTDAGVVSIDELEGIANYTTFKTSGGDEYDKHFDRGTHMSFWDGRGELSANEARVEKLDHLFKEKYPDMPTDKELPWPKCDFDK